MAMIPVPVRRWWCEEDCVVLLRLNKANAVFERESISGLEEILTIGLGSEGFAAQRANLDRDLTRLVGKDVRLLLCLDADSVLRRTVILPLAVEENLRQALTFELDRFTPFKPEQVYFDFRVLDRDSGQRRLTVALAVVPRSLVDQEIARTVAIGVRVGGVTLADGVLHNQERFNFLPIIARERKSQRRLWARVGLSALLGLLLAALLGIPIWQKRAAAISLLEPLAKAQASATETEQLRDRLDKLVAEHDLLPSRKWDSPSALLVLDELSKRLKDDTFLTVLEFDGKSVQLQGESGAASGLVEILDASPMFKDVAFKAQLTKIQGTSVDRFHIVAVLDSAAKPKSVAPSESPSTDIDTTTSESSPQATLKGNVAKSPSAVTASTTKTRSAEE